MNLVVDASVALQWFLVATRNELHLDEAQAVAATIERSDTRLFAPPHWEAEVIAVLARTGPSLIEKAILLLGDMRPTTVSDMHVLRRAADMSTMLDHHLFDTLYHAVALEEGATLVTADAVYFGKARHLGGIALLSQFTAPS